MEELHEVEVSASLPARDGFLRVQPAESFGPDRGWALARQVTDYGCAVLSVATMRPDRRLRDAVLTALLRRLLITSEGITVLLSKGLVEPAMAQGRTLLDIELAFRLIHQDSTDHTAKRLAAYHYLAYQEHSREMLKNRPTRESVAEGPGTVPELIEVAKSYARFLELPIFDDVRQSVETDHLWHGFPNVKAAFQAIGHDHDYFVVYDGDTLFVHASNVDHDFAEITETGLSLKPLVERNPALIQLLLGHNVLRCIEMIALYLEDTGQNIDERIPGAKAELHEGGETTQISSISGLRIMALRQFDIRSDPFGGPRNP